jgi:hypothetical protein
MFASHPSVIDDKSRLVLVIILFAIVFIDFGCDRFEVIDSHVL